MIYSDYSLNCAKLTFVLSVWIFKSFIKSCFLDWWPVRVTLVVDWLFLSQHFGPVVGTYEGLLRLCECKWGGDSTCRWWGHLKTTCHNQTCLNFMHWEVVRNKKTSLKRLAPFCALVPSCPLMCEYKWGEDCTWRCWGHLNWTCGGDLWRPFAAMWMQMGWGFYLQVVGTPQHYMS